MVIIKFTESKGDVNISPLRLSAFAKLLEKDLSLSNAFSRVSEFTIKNSFDAKIVAFLSSIESQSRIIVSKIDDDSSDGVIILKMDKLGNSGRYYAIGEIKAKLSKLREKIKTGKLWEAEF